MSTFHQDSFLSRSPTLSTDWTGNSLKSHQIKSPVSKIIFPNAANSRVIYQVLNLSSLFLSVGAAHTVTLFIFSVGNRAIRPVLHRLSSLSSLLHFSWQIFPPLFAAPTPSALHQKQQGATAPEAARTHCVYAHSLRARVVSLTLPESECMYSAVECRPEQQPASQHWGSVCSSRTIAF